MRAGTAPRSTACDTFLRRRAGGGTPGLPSSPFSLPLGLADSGRGGGCVLTRELALLVGKQPPAPAARPPVECPLPVGSPLRPQPLPSSRPPRPGRGSRIIFLAQPNPAGLSSTPAATFRAGKKPRALQPEPFLPSGGSNAE